MYNKKRSPSINQNQAWSVLALHFTLVLAVFAVQNISSDHPCISFSSKNSFLWYWKSCPIMLIYINNIVWCKSLMPPNPIKTSCIPKLSPHTHTHRIPDKSFFVFVWHSAVVLGMHSLRSGLCFWSRFICLCSINVVLLLFPSHSHTLCPDECIY